MGCSSGGELHDINALNVERTVAAIRHYQQSDFVVGVKVRLSSALTHEQDTASTEAEAYSRALAVSRQTGLPLAVHHANSTLTLDQCPGLLQPGDIYTHCFSSQERVGTSDTFGTITLDGKTIHPAVLAARERGVLFDVGHGNGAFSWPVAELFARHGMWPDIISTDLHAASIHGPAYDMPTTMTKFLMLGMPLREVVRASTITAAGSFRWADRIGTLGEGRVADIAVLERRPCDALLEDSFGQLRHCTERLVARAVWRQGEPYAATDEKVWPNPEEPASKYKSWFTLKIRDETSPPEPSADVLQRLHARQEQYAFLAQAMARFGGDSCSQNLPLYVSPARLGHLSERWGGGWAVLPFCAQPATLVPAHAKALGDSPQPESESDEDGGSGVRLTRRQLIAYASTQDEQERLRRALYASCC